MSMQNHNHIAIVGAGAAGLIAAGAALSQGADVTIFEHNSKAGRKLLITGKGRCNVTNNCSPSDFMQSIVSNPRFLYSAINSFTPADLMQLIEDHGTPLKTERGRRVFPVSDISGDILSALLRYAKGAKFIHEHVVSLLTEDNHCKGVCTSNGTYRFDAVIIATGGKSYPRTGSDGSGYQLASSVGHSITDILPSLVPLTSPDLECLEMQGLSLRNVGITVANASGLILYEDFGELLFTHFGVSGPTILSASSCLSDISLKGYTLSIDLKPALTFEQLDKRLLSDFAKFSNRHFSNGLESLLPQKMIPVFIKKTGIDPNKKLNSITREERHTIITHLKSFCIRLDGRRSIEEAIITRGGVCIKEIHPKTMASKLCQGLYFAGEILDVDAYTGGYNLQIAFSTAVLAGENAAQ